MTVHQNLTPEHLNPDNAQKMRNRLAEDVLNKDMLLLMKVSQFRLHSMKYIQFANTNIFLDIQS
jgi:hypothetical protein